MGKLNLLMKMVNETHGIYIAPITYKGNSKRNAKRVMGN